MKFTVNWKPQAEDQLISIWLERADRQAVTAAANEIDRQLKSAPESFGEARSGITRLAVVPPLAVHFDVYAEDIRVDVLTIHFIPRRPPEG